MSSLNSEQRRCCLLSRTAAQRWSLTFMSLSWGRNCSEADVRPVLLHAGFRHKAVIDPNYMYSFYVHKNLEVKS